MKEKVKWKRHKSYYKINGMGWRNLVGLTFIQDSHPSAHTLTQSNYIEYWNLVRPVQISTQLGGELGIMIQMYKLKLQGFKLYVKEGTDLTN